MTQFFDLPTLWFLVMGLVMIGYVMLDGFDLGVGMLHLFAKGDYQRRVFLNAIGPVWDGNEVWLVVLIGASFAGFPHAYATLFSAFYVPMTLLVIMYVFRAIAIEFRSKRPAAGWRQTWDFCFCGGSLVIAFLLGVILGNLVHGLPLDANQHYIADVNHALTPYALLTGVMSVALFTMHGAIYLLLKTEGELHNKIRAWINPAIIFFIMCYAVTTVVTLIYHPYMVDRLRAEPWLFAIAFLNMLAIANIPHEVARGRDWRAFLSSCVAMLLLLSLFGLGTFPTLIRSTINPGANSLTIYNADSSELTLKVLLVIVLVGIPLVLLYTYNVYRLFRGKVKIDPHSY